MAVKDQVMWVESDTEFDLVFFYCCLCPLSLPFLETVTAEAYKEGHKLNTYHKRRLELLR